MHEQTSLERSCRRLLLAYPRFYRRERGLEILTTMLEAAKPGQTRATRGEAAHLLLCGLKVRLVPPGWASRIAAGVVTLWVAVVLGAVGAYITWSSHSVSPSDLDDPGIAALGDELAGRPASRVDLANSDPLEMAYSYKSWADFQSFGAEGWAGPRPTPSGHTRMYAETGSAQTILATAHQHLRDAGWQTGAITRPNDCPCDVFWAARDGLLLRMAIVPISGQQSNLVVRFHHAEPGGVRIAAVAGFLGGLVLAWPLMTWLAHRLARTTRGDRALALLSGLPALYACLANTVDNVLSMVPDPDTDSVLLAADLMYPLANQAANPLAAIVIALGLAASLIILAYTPWQRHRRHRASEGAARASG